MNLLFLCTGNSCRSIMAEATFNHLAPHGWRATSAGSQPTGYVHPRALALLERHGIPARGTASKSWNAIHPAPEVVISVCGNAAGETCPVWMGPVLRSHWGVEDPAHATGTDTEIDAAFETAWAILHRRIRAFAALPVTSLTTDRAAFQAALDEIGRLP
jgi:protein-tyrosine-phosphatase